MYVLSFVWRACTPGFKPFNLSSYSFPGAVRSAAVPLCAPSGYGEDHAGLPICYVRGEALRSSW